MTHAVARNLLLFAWFLTDDCIRPWIAVLIARGRVGQATMIFSRSGDWLIVAKMASEVLSKFWSRSVEILVTLLSSEVWDLTL